MKSLSERESQIAALVAQGMMNKEIARALGMLDTTVKVHVRNLFLKVGVRNRVELAMMIKCKDCPMKERISGC
jgi:DNA-binding NarL/FixJ family response regulator